MTIDEAIEILNDFREQESGLLGNEFREASSLGVEALKAISHFRSLYMPGICPKLPGETEE